MYILIFIHIYIYTHSYIYIFKYARAYHIVKNVAIGCWRHRITTINRANTIPSMTFLSFSFAVQKRIEPCKELATHVHAQLKSSSVWEHLRASRLGCAAFSQVAKVFDPEAEKKPDTEKRAIMCHHVSSVSHPLEVIARVYWWKWKSMSCRHAYFLFEGILGDIQYAHDLGVVLRRKEELKAAREKRAKELKRGPGVEDWA